MACRLRNFAAALALLVPGSALAAFHFWDINEVYSNADGSVQYIELFTPSNGQQFVGAHDIESSNADGSLRATYTFPTDSPAPTGGRNLLLATAAAQSQMGITADYLLPDNFLDPNGGNVNFLGADDLDFGAFPSDPTLSIQFDGSTAQATPTNYAMETGTISPVDVNVVLISSVLPTSRSVSVGSTATAFATVINSGSSNGTDCGITPVTAVTADFFYQTTDPATNALVGTQDTPVDIDAQATQTYLFGITPTAAFASTEVALQFSCANSNDAASVVGLNTLQLSASDTPVADIVALASTTDNDGIAHIPGTNGVGFFTLASVNVGAAGSIFVDADTGGAVLPLTLTLCQTDPNTAACINPVTPVAGPINLNIGSNETPTFAVFVTGSGDISLDPAGSRVFVRFSDAGGEVRGSTSVAVQTDL